MLDTHQYEELSEKHACGFMFQDFEKRRGMFIGLLPRIEFIKWWERRNFCAKNRDSKQTSPYISSICGLQWCQFYGTNNNTHTEKKGWDETGLRTSITFIYAFPSPVTCVIYNATIRYPTRGSLLFLLSICAEHTHLRLLLIRLCVLWTPILKHTILFTSRCSNRIKFRLSFLPPAIVAHCLLACCCSPMSVVDVHRCAWFLPTGTARYAVYAAPLETFSLWDAI